MPIKLWYHLETTQHLPKKEFNILNIGVMTSLKPKSYLLQIFR